MYSRTPICLRLQNSHTFCVGPWKLAVFEQKVWSEHETEERDKGEILASSLGTLVFCWQEKRCQFDGEESCPTTLCALHSMKESFLGIRQASTWLRDGPLYFCREGDAGEIPAPTKRILQTYCKRKERREQNILQPSERM